MNRTPDDIRIAIDTTLSGASHDPTLFGSVVNASKGDLPPVKRKMHVALIMSLILLIAGSALAASFHIAGIQDFFKLRNELSLQGLASENEETFLINQRAVVRPSRQRHTSEIVDFTVKEVYRTNKAIYVFAILTPKAENTVIIPITSDPAQEPENDALLRSASRQKGTQVYTIFALQTLNIPGTSQSDIRSRYIYQRRLDDGSIAVMASFPVDEISYAFKFNSPSTLETTFTITNARNQNKEYNTSYFDITRLEEQDHGDYPF